MNTKISYLYRDADNYKMHNKCVIAGTLTTEQARTIKDTLWWNGTAARCIAFALMCCT